VHIRIPQRTRRDIGESSCVFEDQPSTPHVDVLDGFEKRTYGVNLGFWKKKKRSDIVTAEKPRKSRYLYIATL
jgi:hypothetical protein